MQAPRNKNQKTKKKKFLYLSLWHQLLVFLNIVLIVLISRWYITFRIFLFQAKKIQLSKKLLTNGICSCCSTRREKKKKRHKLVHLVYSQPIMTIDGLHAVLLILACSIYFTLYDVCSLGWDVAKKKDQYHVTPFSVMQGILIFKRTKTNHSSSKEWMKNLRRWRATTTTIWISFSLIGFWLKKKKKF